MDMEEIDEFLTEKTQASVERRLWARITKLKDGCWIYPDTFISVGDRMRPVARVSYALYSGKLLFKGKHVCHTCDRPRCINPEHLFQGTPKQNAVDSCKKLRRRRKIDPDDVREIRRIAINNKGVAECMIRYDLTAKHVKDIARKAKGAWDWLPD